MSSTLNITIKSSGDSKYEVEIDSTATVLELKEKIASLSSVEADRQRLIYSGKVLKDADTLDVYKVQSGHTIHLVKGAAKNSSSATASNATAQPASTTTSNTTPAVSGVPLNISSGQGSFNPLADLTGARYAGYTQLPSASMFGPDGGMNGMAPDPEEMERMMSTPGFQESLLAMLSNPQMLDFFIQQLPQLQAMGPQAREVLQSPFFRQMISNPEFIRPMLQNAQSQARGGNAFPAPGLAGPNSGSTQETDSTATTGTGTGSTGSTGSAAANPFASFFPPPGAGSAGNAGGLPNFDPAMLASFFGGSGAGVPGAGAAAAPADNRPPEERYENQLRQLNDMGFFDFDRNVEALRRTGGSVQGAIEYLLSSQ